jgi:hypothetical protein
MILLFFSKDSSTCSQLSYIILSYSNESLFIDKSHSNYDKYCDSDNKTKAYVEKGYRFETNDTSNQAMPLEYMMKEN